MNAISQPHCDENKENLIDSPVKQIIDNDDSFYENEIKNIDEEIIKILNANTNNNLTDKKNAITNTLINSDAIINAQQDQAFECLNREETGNKASIKHNNNKSKVNCFPDVNLRCKYSEIGVMRMNFFDILQEKEDYIRKRTSRVFRSFSHHYACNENISNNLNYPNNHSPKKIFNLAASPGENISNIQSNNSHAKNLSAELNQNGNANNKIAYISPSLLNDKEYSDVNVNIIKFNIFDSINSAFYQEVINNGREIGKIDGFICINKIPSIKQIICGVHTERGLDISSNYLTVPNHYNNTTNNNINQNTAISQANTNGTGEKPNFANLPSELKQINLNCEMLLSKLIQKSSFNFKEISIRDLNQEITSTLEALVKLLSLSCKQNCLVYNYSCNEEIATAQNMILELGCNIIQVLDEMINEQRQQGYKLLELIIDRTELDLVNMSLAQYYTYSNPLKELKNKVIEKFLSFMTQLLDYTLEKLGRKVNDNNLKTFIENFLAYAYFRVPKVSQLFSIFYLFLIFIKIGCFQKLQIL